jgi:hypothetical protein
MSVVPPAAYATTMVIGRDGKVCVQAERDSPGKATAAEVS